MVVVMAADASSSDVDHVVSVVRDAGGEAFVSRGESRTIIGLSGDIERFAATLNLTGLPGVADLLKQALPTFDLVAAVSGRTAIDARAMVGLPGLLYIGNHGLEHLSQDDMTVHVRPEAEPWIRAINHVLASIQAPLMGRFPGLLIERKTPGGATPELARLKGRRFVAINETSENDQLNEARVTAFYGDVITIQKAATITAGTGSR